MVFRKCTIGGNAYRGNIGLSHDSEGNAGSEAVFVVDIPTPDEGARGDSSDVSRIQEEPKSKNAPTPAVFEKFTDLALQLDISEAFRMRNAPSESSTTLIGFFTVLSLCHSVIAAQDPVTGEVEYRAQSPDEAALVRAAADMGFKFLGKDKEILSLKTPGSDNIEKYELLAILDFTSARKRMSVILRKLNSQDGSLLLLTKGADNIIFDRLQPGADEMKRETEKHLSEFANSGLRTLTLAYKTISGSSHFQSFYIFILTFSN